MGTKKDPDKAIKYLKSINKFDEFMKILDEVTNEVRNDYIKTHLEALTEEKRSSLFSEFPALRTLFEEN